MRASSLTSVSLYDGIGAPQGVEDGRPVGTQPRDANREELHDLPRVVLVGRHAGHRLAAVVQHVQVPAHRGVQRDRPHQVAVVAEGAVHQQAVVRDEGVGRVDFNPRHHPDLVKRPRDTLTKLIGRRSAPAA